MDTEDIEVLLTTNWMGQGSHTTEISYNYPLIHGSNSIITSPWTIESWQVCTLCPSTKWPTTTTVMKYHRSVFWKQTRCCTARAGIVPTPSVPWPVMLLTKPRFFIFPSFNTISSSIIIKNMCKTNNIISIITSIPVSWPASASTVISADLCRLYSYYFSSLEIIIRILNILQS